jgi:hypothetical protein
MHACVVRVRWCVWLAAASAASAGAWAAAAADAGRRFQSLHTHSLIQKFASEVLKRHRLSVPH